MIEVDVLKKEILSLAREFLNCPTAPFREERVRQFILQFCSANALPYSVDAMGNIVVQVGKEKCREQYAFVAHMDHPGFIAETDSKDGMVKALFYGGWNPDEFRSAPVRFFSRSGESRGTAVKWTRSPSQKARRALINIYGEVKRGDPGMWDFPPFESSQDRVYSRSCDDGVGCVILLCAIKELLRKQSSSKVLFVFTVAEEAGLHGAKYLCLKKKFPPETIPVSVECSRELAGARMGEGVIIRIGDSRTVFSPEVSAIFLTRAQETASGSKKFRYQRRLMDGGRCEGSVFSDFGYNTGALCVALGNYHNRNFEKRTTEPEFVDVDDMTNAVELIIAIVRGCNERRDGKKKPALAKEVMPLGQVFYNQY